MKNRGLEFFLSEVSGFLPPENIITDHFRRTAFGQDASFYRYIPSAILKAGSENDIQKIIISANKYIVPVTFRAAGTSLCGQGVTDSVLISASRDWNEFSISEDASKVTMTPSAIGGKVNLSLARFNRKLGPDPASVNSAMIGGIAANNASGMTSGIDYSCYSTLDSIRAVFSDGSILDTSEDESVENFMKSGNRIAEYIAELAVKIKADQKLSDVIREKYRIKNTTGYGLNSLIDFNNPKDIIQHLLIGSEGTLGFISQITLKTVPDFPHKATAFVVFGSVFEACSFILKLDSQKVNAAELFDSNSIKAVSSLHEIRKHIQKFDNSAAALLIELTAESAGELSENIAEVREYFKLSDISNDPVFVDDPKEYSALWNIRKGLFPAICKSRTLPSTVIIEDVCFKPENLAEGVTSLKELFNRFGYNEAAVWGHAISGNTHFVIYRDFTDPAENLKYKHFMDALAFLIIRKFSGSLKAEHGTGRNMAPFVEFEWGKALYSVMKEIKRIFDPKGILNPGVIINDDRLVHLKNIKKPVLFSESGNKCIDCGFCEDVCPSKNLTLTPRQRLIMLREIELCRLSDDLDSASSLTDLFSYYGIETCASDGLCANRCPAGINTGNVIKLLKSGKHSPSFKDMSKALSENFSTLLNFLRISLLASEAAGKILPVKLTEKLTLLLNEISGNLIPFRSRFIPRTLFFRKGKNKDSFRTDSPSVVYFPSCLSRTMSPPAGSSRTLSQYEVITEVLGEAGFNIIIPESTDNLCCGMPFASKGLFETADEKSAELTESLMSVSESGKYPVLFDTTACYLRMKEFLALQNNTSLEILEPALFIEKYLMDKIHIEKLNKSAMFHIVCSAKKAGLEESYRRLATTLVTNPVFPEDIECCGFAGDKGFFIPELNRSALKDLKTYIPEGCTDGYSSGITCETGLSANSGIEYKSIFYLLHNCMK